MGRIKIILLTLIVILSPFSAAIGQKKITITDLEKRKIEVPLNPERIICLGPGSLRLICYLGQIKKVVGVETFEKTRAVGRTYLHAYPELAKLPAIGPGGPAGINKEPDLEAVLRVKPQLIFVANMQAGVAEGLQKKLGIPVVILSYGGFATFDEVVFDSIRLVGKILLSEQRAEQIMGYIQNIRQELLTKTKEVIQANKTRVYIGGIGYRGTQGIESTDASYFPLEWVRAHNLAQEGGRKGHLFVEKEKILFWNPDLIFIDGGGWRNIQLDFQKKPEFYRQLHAFQKERVYLLFPYNWYVTNIDTALADAFAAGKILYPHVFAHLDLQKKADEIYSFLLGKSVYQQMEQEFGPLGGQIKFGQK